MALFCYVTQKRLTKYFYLIYGYKLGYQIGLLLNLDCY